MESVEFARNVRRYQMNDRYLFKAKLKKCELFPEAQQWVQGYYVHTAESDYITNLPLRIFTSYANKVAYNGGNITEWCGNKVANDAGGKFKFHSLKIYDHSGNLVYDIVPEYAVIGGVPQAVLKDTLTPDRVYSVQRLGQDKMSYYRV